MYNLSEGLHLPRQKLCDVTCWGFALANDFYRHLHELTKRIIAFNQLENALITYWSCCEQHNMLSKTRDAKSMSTH
jgi:regulator of sigma D